MEKNVRVLVYAIVSLALIGIGYSLYVTVQSGAIEKGIIVCPDERCYWTQHIHTYVPITICDEDVRLSTEVGSLQAPHTHEEKNTIHFHDRLPYDKATQTVLDTRLLTIGAFFDEINVTFGPDRIKSKANGDTCGDGSVGTLKMFVNGIPSNAYRDYIWTDKDVIVLVFDNRTVEDVQAELVKNPIVFPALGRG